MSELGRYPFYLDIIKAMLKYWRRLENLDRNSLLYDALECSKSMEGCNNSWYNSIKQFSELLNIPLTSSVGMKQSSFIKKLAKVLKQKYLEEWYSLKQKYLVGKLDTYTKIKCNFGFEKYLNTQDFPHRRGITRLRISAHRLDRH